MQTKWCDSTVNPIMGCGGCEPYPAPQTILEPIDDDLINAGIRGWKRGTASKVFNRVLSVAWPELLETVDELGAGHVNEVNTTIRHLRHRFGAELAEPLGTKASKLAIAAIERNLSFMLRGSASRESRVQHRQAIAEVQSRLRADI